MFDSADGVWRESDGASNDRRAIRKEVEVSETFVVTARHPTQRTEFPARYLSATGKWVLGIDQARRFANIDEIYDTSVPSPTPSIISISYGHLTLYGWIETWRYSEACLREERALRDTPS